VVDHGRDRHGMASLYIRENVLELWERGPIDLLDVHVDDPATGQSNGEGIEVGDAVPLQHRRARRQDLLGELIDRALDAAAGHGPEDGPV
jgi:hypothetical protein